MVRRLAARIATLVLAGALSMSAASAQELFSLVHTPFASDSWTIRRYDAATGAALGTFGSLAGMSFAEDIAFGPEGDLYVCDLGNNRVLRLDGETGAGVGTIGHFPTLLSPQCIAFDPGGGLLVSSHTSIQRFDPQTGAYLGRFGKGGGFPVQMAFAPDGDLYCTTSAGKVERYDGASGAWLGVFVSATSQQGGIAGAGGLAFGPDGNLYATSRVTGDIRRFDGATGAPLGPFAADGFFTSPDDLEFGADGNLYVGDRDAIKVYDGETGALIRYVVQTGDVFEKNQRLAFRSAIPEPGTLALLALAPAVLLRRCRRRD